MHCYYGHVNGATDFFKHLPQESAGYGGMFSTHPDMQKRVEDIEMYSTQKGYVRAALQAF